MTTEVKCFRIPEKEDPRTVVDKARLQNPGLLVQGVREGETENEFFFKMVATQTLRAAATGNLLAKKPEIDITLRLAGTTQISDAIGRVGTKRGEPFILVVAGEKKAVDAVCRQQGWRRLLGGDLSEGELLLIEKAALLNARKG